MGAGGSGDSGVTVISYSVPCPPPMHVHSYTLGWCVCQVHMACVCTCVGACLCSLVDVVYVYFVQYVYVRVMFSKTSERIEY